MKKKKQKLYDKRQKRRSDKKAKNHKKNIKKSSEKNRVKALKPNGAAERLIDSKKGDQAGSSKSSAVHAKGGVSSLKAVGNSAVRQYSKLADKFLGCEFMKKHADFPVMPVFVLFMTLLMLASGHFFKKSESASVPAVQPVIAPEKLAVPVAVTSTFLTTEAPEAALKPLPESHKIKNFDIIFQEPELPTGCEITALTMLMNYYGCDTDKITMAEKYLPKAELHYSYDSSGKKIGTDFENYFMGSPFSSSGCVCGTPAIKKAADDFFRDKNKNYEAVDISGASPEELYRYISEDDPVFILCTIGMFDRQETQGWYNENKKDRYIEWSTNDHGAVLTGYSADKVTVADPIVGTIEPDRKQFEKVFAERGNACVIIREKSNKK